MSSLVHIESPTTLTHMNRALTLLQSGRCRHVYLDLGTNIGMQIRKLYEPELYPQSPMLPLFDKYFGHTNRTSVCTFAFEPNPRWSASLQQLEATFAQRGFPLVVFTDTAVHTHHGVNLTFYRQPHDLLEVGASLFAHDKKMHNLASSRVTVGTVSISQFLLSGIVSRPGYLPSVSATLMKVDIEGAEYRLLPHLLYTGALCAVDVAVVELHRGMVSDTLSDNRQFFCHFNWLLRHWPSTHPLNTGGGASKAGGGTQLHHRPMTHPSNSRKSGGNKSIVERGGDVGIGVGGGGSGSTVLSGGTCRTQVVSLDDETYFSNTTLHNDRDGDGFKDGETIPDDREDNTSGGKGNTRRWGGIDVDRGVWTGFWHWLLSMGQNRAGDPPRSYDNFNPLSQHMLPFHAY